MLKEKKIKLMLKKIFDLLKNSVSLKGYTVFKTLTKFTKKISQIIDFLIFIVSIFLCFFAFYTLFDSHKVFENADYTKYQEYKPDTKKKDSFYEILKLNKDVIGWVDIYGTNIDYPILQSTDNEKYLNTTVFNEFSTAGSIFLDFRNKSDFTDFKNILYGHFMEHGKMFGDISKFKEESFFKNHKYGVLHRKNKKSLGIEIFSLINVNGLDEKIFSDTLDKESLLKYIKERKKYIRNVKIKENEKLLLLNTCDFSFTNGRYILVCKLTENIEKNTFLKEKKRINVFSVFLERVENINFLYFSIILWILLILIYFVFKIFIYKENSFNKK